MIHNLREYLEERMARNVLPRSAGVHDKLPLELYIRDPAERPSLSASIAHLLLTRSPRHAWLAHPRLNPEWKPSFSDRADLGTLAHAMLLEGAEWQNRIDVINAPDYRSKAAQIARDAARAEGKLPVLAAVVVEVGAMVAEALLAIQRRDLELLWDRGRVEQTILWENQGISMRTRPDWVSEDWSVLVDYKTTSASAEPDAWARTHLLHHGYDLQAAMQIAGVLSHRPGVQPEQMFLVQETDPPYACSWVSLAPSYLDFAQERLGHAMGLWRECLSANRWPGYPARTCYIDAPTWATHQWASALLRADEMEEGGQS